MKLVAVSCSFLFLVSSTLAHAAATGKPNTINSPWQFDFGSRYLLSHNSYTNTLYGDIALPPLSRLSYENETGNAAEVFWQLTHQSGLFIKGYVGGGSIANGQMYDEDFPPLTTPYSETYQRQKNGMFDYLSSDFGYTLFYNRTWQLGVFLGYHYWTEQLNTFGCIQTASNTDICGVVPDFSVSVPDSANTLNNNANWSSLRIGTTTTAWLNSHLKLTTDLAYIRSHIAAQDFHNMRPQIRGLNETGTGNGFQIEGLVHWMVNANWSLGAGARWWHIVTDGLAHFEETASGGQPQPLHMVQDSYGLLLQTNYQFNNPSSKVSISWSGPYMGVNIGYGTNPQTASIYTISDYVPELISPNLPTVPQGISLQNVGFVGGGQLGYNWLIQSMMLGAEADFSYSHISGTNGVSLAGALNSVKNNLNSLVTLRGRVGKIATDNVMVYLTGGPAIGDLNLAFDQRVPGVDCNLAVCSTGVLSSKKTGWAAGAGVEFAVAEHATLKAEYLYVDLGTQALYSKDSLAFNATYLTTIPFNANLFRVGINYKK